MIRNIAIATASLALAACTTTTDGSGTEGPMNICKAEPGQYAVGQKSSTDLAKKLLKETGAKTLRWIPPRTAVTMDFRGDRLNIAYDDDMIITQVSCG